MKPRIIWMIIAGLVLATLLFLAVQLVGIRIAADNLIDDPVAPNPPTETADGIMPLTVSNLAEFSDETGRKMRISGRAEPGSVIVLQNRGERMRQVKSNTDGNWGVTVTTDAQAMVIEVMMFMGDGEISIRSDETIFRIPVPNAPNVAAAEFVAPALIMVSAPGSPTRIIQSPFGGAPTNGSITMGAVDYDDAGGVIFSGTSSENGRIRLYAGDQVIGETRIGEQGRWNYIAGNMLPFGEYVIRAELIKTNNQRERISVPFERLRPLERPQGNDGALSVKFEPYRWQVRRSLIGGGTQSTVVFAPNINLPEDSEAGENAAEESAQ